MLRHRYPPPPAEVQAIQNLFSRMRAPQMLSCATLTQLPDMPPIVVPDCTSGETLAYCLSIGFVIDVASPISVGPSFNSLWYCAQDAPPTFDVGLALGTTNGIPGPLGQDFAPQLPGETGTFTGCEYWSGTISGTVGIAEVGGITPLIIPMGFEGEGSSIFPEPHTSLLFMSGLLLISLGGIVRKRFGITSRS